MIIFGLALLLVVAFSIALIAQHLIDLKEWNQRPPHEKERYPKP